jgi:hypothetical protein
MDTWETKIKPFRGNGLISIICSALLFSFVGASIIIVLLVNSVRTSYGGTSQVLIKCNSTNTNITIPILPTNKTIVLQNCSTPIFCFGISSNDYKVCNGNGICVSNDTCICITNSFISGPECSLPVQGGASCNNLYDCFVGPDNVCIDNKCVCTPTYYGPTCSIPIPLPACDKILIESPQSCHGHGICGLDGLTQCLC